MSGTPCTVRLSFSGIVQPPASPAPRPRQMSEAEKSQAVDELIREFEMDSEAAMSRGAEIRQDKPGFAGA